MTATAPSLAELDTHAAELQFRPWPDAVLARLGYPLRHPYVEAFYPSFVGPTGTLLLRRLGLSLAVNPEGFTLPMDVLASALGLGLGRGPQSPLGRTLRRVVSLGLLTVDGPTALGVRTHVAPLRPGLVERLAPQLQADHANALLERGRQ